MYDAQLSQIITEAVSGLRAEMEQAAPLMARPVSGWMAHLAGTAQPEDYFKHPLAFPALLLPWWLEKTLAGSPDIAFQADLVYSTINGYYYIRLIDNLMDGHATVELKLLPALNFFHTRFQMAYQRYFPPEHPFWADFTKTWFRSGEVALADAALTNIDRTQFEQIAAQKVCAAKIPLAAVGYRHNRPDVIEPWSQLVDRLGCWHQFANDLFDWHRDSERQTATYFLSQAERRRNENESLAGWVAREGFEWGIEKLEGWMSTLKTVAHQLESPDLLAYLNTRQQMLRQQQAQVSDGLKSLAKIVAVAK